MDADQIIQTIQATKLIVTAVWLCLVAQAEWRWNDNTPGQEVWYVFREVVPAGVYQKPLKGRWRSGVPP